MEKDKERFLKYLKDIRRLSDNTIKSYERDLRQYDEYLIKRNLNYLEMTDELLTKYIRFRARKGIKSTTVHRIAASLRTFYEYLTYEIGKLSSDPTQKMKVPKLKREKPVILTALETERLLAAPDRTTEKGKRDSAILEFAYATGMRASEIINLNLDNINVEDSYVMCNTENKERVIPLGKICKNALKRYIEEAREHITGKEDGISESPLFVNMQGNRLTRQGYWRIIKEYKDKAEITKDITPQVLRHSFAIHLLKNGADIVAISAMLGHSDLSSTELYLKVIEEDIKEAYKNSHPRA